LAARPDLRCWSFSCRCLLLRVIWQWFRPAGRVPFGKRPKRNQKVLPPPYGSRCARLPSLHHCSRGPPRRAIPGPSRLSRHPCRSTPYTTIPFGLLKGAGSCLWLRCRFCRVLLARRAVHRSGVVGCLRRDHPTKAIPGNSVSARSAWTSHQATRSRIPVRRPSGGVAQGDEPHGCGERLEGPWMALASRPPERHWKEGSLAAGQTRMPGALSLWLLSLCACKEKVTRRARRNL
jgi:hypothetical protein